METQVNDRIKVKTVILEDGLTIVVDPDVLDDWEVIELMDEAESNPVRFPRLIKHVLGDSQYAKIKDFCRGEDGRVKVEMMGETFAQIMEKAAPNS